MAVTILLEGRPGAGKTTVAARLAALLQERGIEVRGFVTREIRERGRRVGFEVETLDGERGTLAHVNLSGPPRVGRYGVDLDAFEQIALPVLASLPRNGVVLIDELGKMELASTAFREAVTRIFKAPVDVVATIHVFRNAFTDRLKTQPGTDLVRVTGATRDELPEQLADRLSRGKRERQESESGAA
jgi:nucleoside-triphosphatase